MHQKKSRISLETVVQRSEVEAPSTKAKDDITRISNLLVESAIIYEALRLEGFSIGIDFLITSHAPISTI